MPRGWKGPCLALGQRQPWRCLTPQVGGPLRPDSGYALRPAAASGIVCPSTTSAERGAYPTGLRWGQTDSIAPKLGSRNHWHSAQTFCSGLLFARTARSTTAAIDDAAGWSGLASSGRAFAERAPRMLELMSDGQRCCKRGAGLIGAGGPGPQPGLFAGPCGLRAWSVQPAAPAAGGCGSGRCLTCRPRRRALRRVLFGARNLSGSPRGRPDWWWDATA